MHISIKKGLDIPLTGQPEKTIEDGKPVKTVAALGTDVVGLKPRMAVRVGDRVRLGQTLFVDKRNPAVEFTSPGAGEVVEVNRGARRALQSVVVRVDGDDAEEYQQYDDSRLSSLDRDSVVKQIVASGLWTAIRTRPFSRIPDPESTPAAIFVTAVDTCPLAPDPAWIINDAGQAFQNGLTVLAHLTGGNVYVNTKPDPGFDIPGDAPFVHSTFDGPHPAGLPGTHIHFLEPVSENKTVWHIRYQHVVSIGRLFAEGRLPTRRIVALTGPMAIRPRLIRTRIGASTEDLLKDEIKPGPVRVISGSALSGHRAAGPLAWLNRYHNQLTILSEDSPREFMAWAKPGSHKYSSTRAFLGHVFNRGGFDLATNQNGSPRAMVSTGSFESMMPLDVLATPLLKALLVEDTDRAKALGCLELDEEDLALCSFVCSGKYDYGPYLRMNLDEIEANG